MVVINYIVADVSIANSPSDQRYRLLQDIHTQQNHWLNGHLIDHHLPKSYLCNELSNLLPAVELIKH
jgi:hypothetical protein